MLDFFSKANVLARLYVYIIWILCGFLHVNMCRSKTSDRERIAESRAKGRPLHLAACPLTAPSALIVPVRHKLKHLWLLCCGEFPSETEYLGGVQLQEGFKSNHLHLIGKLRSGSSHLHLPHCWIRRKTRER